MLSGSWTLRWAQAGWTTRRNVRELSLGVLPAVDARVVHFRQHIDLERRLYVERCDLEFESGVATWSAEAEISVNGTDARLWYSRASLCADVPLGILDGFVNAPLVIDRPRDIVLLVLTSCSRIDRDSQMRLSMLIKEL